MGAPAAQRDRPAVGDRRAVARRSRAEVLVNAVAATSVGLVLADVVLLLIRRQAPADDTLFLADAVLAVGLSALATAIARRDPRNRLAWLFLVVGFGFAEYLFFSDLAVALGADHPAYPYVAMVGYLGGEIGWPAIWLLAQIYPDGRTLTSRWRWFWRVSVAWWLMGLTLTALRVRPELNSDFENPFGLSVVGEVEAVLPIAVLRFTWAVIALGTLVSLALRTWRARGIERAQMKVFFLAILPLPISVIFLYTTPYAWLLCGVAALGWPLGLGVAVLRHRLYDVDRVFSRTLGYLVVSGVLLGTYVLLVTGLSRLLPVSDTAGVVVAVVLTALLFDPLRRRIGRWVDRRFNRAWVDGQRVVADFAVRARDELTVEAVRGDLVATVEASLSPAATLVWVAPPTAPR